VDTDDFEQLCQRFADDLRAARQEAGLSQEALALAAEVDRTYVSQLERGVANPSMLILCRLAGALRMKLRLSLVPDARQLTQD
jgi:transcriptional regulator with XRE-family HTH domain